MASVPPASTAPSGQHDAHTAHPPFLAHHFDTPQQQFDSATLGMWLFVATEILMFSGLFCAYAYFRMQHPEIFTEAYKRHYLSVSWGAVNTVVLLVSSFTMATAVWAAQTGRRQTLIAMLTLTLLCAAGFLGVKYIEYSKKIEKGLLWGKLFNPKTYSGSYGHEPDAVAAYAEPPAPAAAPVEAEAAPPADPDAVSATFTAPAAAPTGALPADVASVRLTAEEKVRNMHIFFGIYYVMTGLHGVHVVAGMIAIGWLLVGACLGRFTPGYFTPVPMVGLYWHVVDLVWIYLFPLLYLIH